MATGTTGAQTAAPVQTAPPLTDQEIVRELLALERQFPPPDESDRIRDARWYEANAPALDEQYRGRHVAIMNCEVVGHDWNALRLELDVARKYHVHPHSFLVVYILPSAFE